MDNISHLEKEMVRESVVKTAGATCLHSVGWMASWRAEADLSQDTEICALQMYLEGHGHAALLQPSSFKFNDNSFMQNMRPSGAIVGWRTEAASCSCSLAWSWRTAHCHCTYDNIHENWWERSVSFPFIPSVCLAGFISTSNNSVLVRMNHCSVFSWWWI